VTKISIIGAGSAVFSLNLVKDLCLTPGLWGSTLSLMDIDAERLDIIYRLAKRYIQELTIDLEVEQTTLLETTLRDADFVINTAYVKGHEYAQKIRDIASQHGYYYYRDYYSIPEPGPPALTNFEQLNVTLDIARQMETFCPDAYLLQASNPVFELTTLLTRSTEIKICGICHGHLHYRDIASTLDLDPAQVTAEAPGLNHCIWLTHFQYQGKNAYPLIDEWIETQAHEYWRTHVSANPFDIQMSPAAVHQYQLFGLFPIGDTVRSGGWWYHTDRPVKHHWFGNPWGGPDTEHSRPHHVHDLAQRRETIKHLLETDTKVTHTLGSHRSLEQHIPLIDAIVNDHTNIFQVNIPNQGVIPELPHDVAVEVPASVNKHGIQPQPIKVFPRKLMLEVLLPRWLAMEHLLETYLQGDRSMLLWNVLQYHHIASLEAAEILLDDWLRMPENMSARRHYT
jgi:alpha-galactosidase